MKTLFISLAALVAVSSAALASERGHVPDSDTHFGKYNTKNKNYTTDTDALIILMSSKKPTIFESMNNFSEENKLPGKDNNKDSKH
jgi:hypothetical protein